MITKITIGTNNDSNWQNAPDTGDLEWSGGSWKDYWIKHSEEKWPERCCRDRCSSPATDGAHVMRLNADNIYIVPLCHEHNPISKEPPKLNPRFSLKQGSVLVNANDEMMDNIAKGKEAVEGMSEVLKGRKIADL